MKPQHEPGQGRRHEPQARRSMSPASSGQPRPALAYARWLDSLTRAGWDAGPAAEQVPVADALGRVSADPIVARWPSPRSDCSAMDGIAVRADRLTGGDGTDGAVGLPAGTFEWIDTGDPMPADANTVVMREWLRPRQDGGVIIVPGGLAAAAADATALTAVRDADDAGGPRRPARRDDRGAAGQERPAGRRGLRGGRGSRPGRAAVAAGRSGRSGRRRACLAAGRAAAGGRDHPDRRRDPAAGIDGAAGGNPRHELADARRPVPSAQRGAAAERDPAGRPGRAGGRDPPLCPCRRPGAGHRRLKPRPRRPRGRRPRPGGRDRGHRRRDPARSPGAAWPRQAPRPRRAFACGRAGRGRAGHRPAGLSTGHHGDLRAFRGTAARRPPRRAPANQARPAGGA